MEGVSEPIKKAAKHLETTILKVVHENLGITLNIRKSSIQDTESQWNSTSAHQRPMPPKEWPQYSHELGRTLRVFPEIKQELGEGISFSNSKPARLMYNEIVSKTYYNRQESEIHQDYQEKSVWSYCTDTDIPPMSDPEPVSPDFPPVFYNQRRNTAINSESDSMRIRSFLKIEKPSIDELQKKVETLEKENAHLNERLNTRSTSVDHSSTLQYDLESFQEGEMVSGRRVSSSTGHVAEETSELYVDSCENKDCQIAILKYQLREKERALKEKTAECQELKEERNRLLNRLLN